MSKTITLADVAKHNTETDCYMAIHGKVYDVTKFLDEVGTDAKDIKEQRQRGRERQSVCVYAVGKFNREAKRRESKRETGRDDGGSRGPLSFFSVTLLCCAQVVQQAGLAYHRRCVVHRVRVTILLKDERDVAASL